jgi:hypothetical protein
VITLTKAYNGRKLLATISVLLCAFAFPALCSGADFTGHWTGTYQNGDGGVYDMTVDLLQTGTSLSGSASGGSACGNPISITSLTGSVSGNLATLDGVFYCAAYGSNLTFSVINAFISGNTLSGGYISCFAINPSDCPDAGSFSLTTTTQQLTVSVSGSGSVSSNPYGIYNCTSSCTSNFNTSSHVILAATPVFGSALTSWSLAGCSAPEPCTVTMDAIKNVTATFSPVCANRLVWLNGSSFYTDIHDAYAHLTTNGESIKMQATAFPEELLLDSPWTVKFQGGFDCAYSSNTAGWSTVDKMTIEGGGITVEQLIIQ